MADVSAGDDGRGRQPANPFRPGVLTALVVFLYALALGVSVFMLWQGRQELGIGGVILVLTLAPVALTMARGEGDRRLLARVDELFRAVRTLADQSSLSDEARRILNRESDREMLRLAITEDINAGNWDAALVLIRELADRFGYRSDAEEFRRRIDALRAETVEREITAAIGRLDALVLERRWLDALLEAAQVQRLYPYSPRVEPLRARVEQARHAYKNKLEREFLMAAQGDRTDEALGILRDLDLYLTPTEAEPLREVARGVIGKARLNLGAQFKLAVQDRRWSEASHFGEQILEAFPNSRMAAEVREMLDGLKVKASALAG